MATVVVKGLSRAKPVARACIVVDPNDYYDFTTNTPKFGALQLSFSGIAISPTTTKTNRIRVTFRPYYYDPNFNDQKVYITTLQSGSFSLSHNHWVAFSHSMFGPSAFREEDGTYSLYEIEIELLDNNNNSLSTEKFDFTVTYTITPTYIDPTVPLVGGTDQILIGEKGIGELYVNPVPSNGFCAIQLQSLESANKSFPPSKVSSYTSIFAGNGKSLLYRTRTSRANQSLITFPRGYLLVYASNNSKLDANAHKVIINGVAYWSILQAHFNPTPGEELKYTLKVRKV